MEASPPPASRDAHGNEPRLGKLVGQIAESRLNNRGEAGEGEHQPGGGLIVETVRGDQKGRMAGNAPFMSHDRCPSDTRKIFFFVHDDDLCPQAGTDEGKRAFPAARRADAAATAQWIVEISDEKARLFLVKTKVRRGIMEGRKG